MKSLLALLALFVSVSIGSAEPFVIVVRHAEKEADPAENPGLSDIGRRRAETLGRMLTDSGIVTIYTSEYKRTIETAVPLARKLNITPTTVSAKESGTLPTKLHELTGNALVVGHGNTIPSLLKALGIDTPIEIPDSDYGQVFIVALGEKPQLLRLRYPPIWHD